MADDNQPTGQVAIAGHRSFIAQALGRELERHGKRVFPLSKASLRTDDLSGFDCVYLVLGRAKPGPIESAEEMHQVMDFLENVRKPRRAVYVSSMSMSEHKLWCERLIREYAGRSSPPQVPVTIIRPGAVFGPDQDMDSMMLIPSMVRAGDAFKPDWPFLLTRFISVDDLAAHLAMFADPGYWDVNRSGQPDSMCDVPGTFTLTPHQVHELHRAFEGLRQNGPRRGGPDQRKEDFLAGVECAESGDIARFKCWNDAADEHVRRR
jgi:hypothetical protein